MGVTIVYNISGLIFENRKLSKIAKIIIDCLGVVYYKIQLWNELNNFMKDILIVKP